MNNNIAGFDAEINHYLQYLLWEDLECSRLQAQGINQPANPWRETRRELRPLNNTCGLLGSTYTGTLSDQQRPRCSIDGVQVQYLQYLKMYSYLRHTHTHTHSGGTAAAQQQQSI